MLEESGKVISVEPDGLWVATIQQSTCGSCRAKKGCGQQLLAKMGNSLARHSTTYPDNIPVDNLTHDTVNSSVNIKAIFGTNNTNHYSVGDSVTIGIPENIIVLNSLFIYCFPLLLMIVFSGIAHMYLLGDVYSIVAGGLGMFLGGVMIRYHSKRVKHNPNYQPVVLDKESQILQVQYP